jgi:hypothetical protein
MHGTSAHSHMDKAIMHRSAVPGDRDANKLLMSLIR